MTVEHPYERQKGLIVLATLIIHMMLCSVLLITNFESSHIDTVSFSNLGNEMDTPVIFQDPSSTPSTADDQQWAAMQARASRFGTPEGDDAALPSSAENLSTTASNSDDSTPDAHDASDDGAESSDTQKETNTTEYQPSMTFPDLGTASAPIPAASGAQKKSGRLTSRLTPTQKKAAQQLAAFAKGYLDQVGTQGDNTVSLVGGDMSRKPTAEQLKYERYWARIQWCLQNSLRINRDRFTPTRPLRCMMKMCLTVNRDGTLNDLQVMQSSGSSDLDAFMHHAFSFAASSFPTLPTYIKDPYSMIWIVDVAIDSAPRWSTSMY